MCADIKATCLAADRLELQAALFSQVQTQMMALMKKALPAAQVLNGSSVVSSAKQASASAAQSSRPSIGSQTTYMLF